MTCDAAARAGAGTERAGAGSQETLGRDGNKAAAVCDEGAGKKKRNEWISRATEKDEYVTVLVNNARALMEKQKFSSGTRSDNFIDFKSTVDLFRLAFIEWETIFHPLFGRTKHYWLERTYYLAKIRNEIARSHMSFLVDYEKNIAIEFCQDILKVISPPVT